MTSVQGGKILADIRTDSFYSGPLRPDNQHTSTPFTDNQHNMLRWQRPRRVEVSEDLSQRGLSWWCSQRESGRTESLPSFERATDTWHTDRHTQGRTSWAEVVLHLRKDSNNHVAIFPSQTLLVAKRPLNRACAVAIFFYIGATKIWVLHNKSSIWWLRR